MLLKGGPSTATHRGS